MRDVARKVDSLNRIRVKEQVMLTGERFKGRKLEKRKRMFARLPRRKNVHINYDEFSATIKHKGKMQRVAAAHHFGSTVSIPKQQQRSRTISMGTKGAAKGDEPCTYEQAGILASFMYLNKHGLIPRSKVSFRQMESVKPTVGKTKGRGIRDAVIKLFQKKYTAAEAGHTIATWDRQYSRKGPRHNYELPARHQLGIMDRDLPLLINFSEERIWKMLIRKRG